MSDWLAEIPIAWLVVVMFAGTAVVTAAIYFGVMVLAKGERTAVLNSLSPGMLPPMALVFGLLVGFLAAQLWSEAAAARAAVNPEAGSLRSVVLLAGAFPGAPEKRLRALVREHIEHAARDEWPAMRRQDVTLIALPAALSEALRYSIALKPDGEGQVSAQREIVRSIEEALDARRQRIIASEASVDWVRWMAVMVLAALTLVAIAMVHCGNRATAALATGIFGVGVAVTLVLIASQDQPFAGGFSIEPDVLLQVLPRQN